MRQLKTYTSLWAMQPHDQTGVKLEYDQVCEMVAGAGFDGMAIDLGASDVATAHARDFGAPFVDVIGQVMPIALDDMVPVIETWMDMSERIGMPIQFETHRNCITNDLYTTLQLIERIPAMTICADLSHYVVDREFWFPLSEHDMSLISRILERSDSFQGRVASRQQIQLQLDFPQHQKWVELFKGWWQEGLTSWRSRNAQGDCIFVCELGPPEYAMTGPDGREMSNRWEEAQVIKSWVEQIWDDLGGNT